MLFWCHGLNFADVLYFCLAASSKQQAAIMTITCACSGLLLRLQNWDPMMCYGFKNCCGSIAIVLRVMNMACMRMLFCLLVSETDFGFWTMLDLGF